MTLFVCEFEQSHGFPGETFKALLRGDRKVLVAPCPTPARCAGEGVDWWHVFGSPVDGDMKPTTEEDGAMFMNLIAGPGPGTGRQGETPLHMTAMLPWLRSFTHQPTEQELEALKPESYREDTA